MPIPSKDAMQKVVRRIHEKKRTGLYQKFKVTRTDGKHRKGKKHEHCRYFVLDMDHDPYAKVALRSYAMACQHEYPALAMDLFKWLGHAE